MSFTGAVYNMTRLGTVSLSPAVTLLYPCPTTGKTDSQLNEAREIAEAILSLQASDMDRLLVDLQQRCRTLLTSLDSHSTLQRPDGVGAQPMTEILATIYSPRWQLVLDPSVHQGSPIRIRDLEAASEDPEIIACLKQDLAEGEPVRNLAGEIIPTAQQATEKAVTAILKNIAIAGGPQVYVVPRARRKAK
ncbi:MAG: hypothetical protein K1X74_04855 [Pirellulales bacterium]|nr:hypothetical protein [Pirellulales bacterium]